MDVDVLTEVPEPLKKLLRYIVRGFYGVEQTLLVDMLIRNACMKEDDLIELLKFDRKQLRAHVNTLKNEHFLKTRMKVETDADGKTTKHNYYFINYTGFVNVVKYKLDHVRRKLETQERDSTRRASFQCPSCEKAYTDLEADHLFDPSTGQFLCMICQVDLKEEQSAAPMKDARTLITRFNEQIEPIYALLKQCEDYKLSQQILEPEPTDIAHLTGDRKPSQTAQRASRGERGTWSGDATKNVDYGFMESTVTVSIDESGAAAARGADKKPIKERPVWMVESTVEGVTRLPEDSGGFSAEGSGSQRAGTAAAAAASAAAPVLPSTDIMQALLVHEKRSGKAAAAAMLVDRASAAAAVASVVAAESGSSSESDDESSSAAKPSLYAAASAEAELMDSDDEEEVYIKIGERNIAFHEVTSEQVAQMTPEEKEHYIRVSQEMYSKLYE